MEQQEGELTKAKEKIVKRLYGLLDLQQKIGQLFGWDEYNIFVFGSYITIHYIEGVSDIDIAIYTENFELYKKISLYIEEYFNNMHIKSDIFYIDINMAAPVYLAPLNSQVQFTEFYPQVLKEFKLSCQKLLDKTKQRMML